MIQPQDYLRDWSLPSLDTWINHEYPQLRAAYISAQGGNIPGDDWAAFQTYRRYLEPNVWTFEKMLAWEQNGGNPPPQPPQENVPFLKIDGPIFRRIDNNQAYRTAGVSGFNLCDQMSKGQNIDSFIDKYSRSNRVRTFAYVPISDWGSNAWDFPSNDNVRKYIEHLLSKKKALNLCLLTDGDTNRITQAHNLVNYLNQFDYPGLILEAKNEPLTHDKSDSNALRSTLEANKYLYGSGVYEDTKKFWGRVGHYHHPRDNEWPRKAKDTIECYQGGGPNFPDEPSLKLPWIHDELIRPDQAGYNTLDFYTFGALASLMSAGVTFHSESGKLGKLPSDQEFGCYNALMDGMSVFPADTPNGTYAHHKDLEEIDPVTNEPTTCLRVFSVKNYAVIVRNKSVKIPLNWKSLDSFKVCYEIL